MSSEETYTEDDQRSFLIWEYLDGEITPPRAQQLSSMLTESAAMRTRFVEYATLHNMLFDYFKQVAKQDAQDNGNKSGRKTGRSPAA